MAIYRIGEMVLMMRKAQGLTQEQLIEIYSTEEEKTGSQCSVSSLKQHYEPTRDICECKNEISGKKGEKSGKNNEICSTQVLHRIEKGTVKRVKKETFQKLMKKLGVLPERTYASILVTDCRALSIKAEIHVHMNQKEYDEAEKKLLQLEKSMVKGYPRNEQYLMEKRATLAYYRGQISAKEYKETLWEALKYTVPMLDEIDIADWPFHMNEFEILKGIVNAYIGMKDREGKQELLMKLKKNIEREYMDRDHYVVWHTFVLACLSQHMRIIGQQERLEEYCAMGIRECKEQRILGTVYRFLYDMAWYKENMLRKEEFTKIGNAEQQEAWIKKEREFCKEQLVQAYYISEMAGYTFETERIKRLCERFYPGEIKLL